MSHSASIYSLICSSAELHKKLQTNLAEIMREG